MTSEPTSQDSLLDPIEDVIAAVGRGEMVIVVDDEDRENEGDLIMAAEKATPEAINFMIREGRGLVCVGMRQPELERLGLAPVAQHGMTGGRFATAFTQSVDGIEGVSTGISASDRAATIQLLADPAATSDGLASPGHVFPIQANDDGVIGRAGHTEAASDLAALAGFAPVGVLCEVLLDDGNMARLSDLRGMADRFNLKLGSVAQLVRFRSELASTEASNG